MTNIDIAVAVVFLLIVLVTGVAFAKLGSEGGGDGFFNGGGVVPWWVSGISLYMSFFSVGTFVVWGSIAYSDGLVAIAIQSTMCIAGVIAGLFFASAWQKTHVTTAAQFIANRLGETTSSIYTVLFLVTSLVSVGALLYPVGKVVEISTDIPLSTSIVVIAVAVILYSAVGGLWAVLVTDLLQFVVLTASILIVVPLAFAEIGGVTQFVSLAPEGFFELTNSEYSWAFLGAFLVYNAIFISGHWGYIQRYTTVRAPSDARRVAWLFSALYALSPIVWMLPPMIYRAMEPDLAGLENEGAYMLVSMTVLPAGLLGLMLSAMIFATASSMNTILNISAAVFTNDIYAKIHQNSSALQKLWVGRISTGVFGLLAVATAFMVEAFGGIVNVVLSVAAIMGSSLFLPPLWALISKRQTAATALGVTIISIATNILINLLPPEVIGFELRRAEQMLAGILIPAISLLLIEVWFISRGRFDPRISNYIAEQEVLDKKRTRLLESSAERRVDQRAIKVISVSIGSVGAMIILLGFLASEASAIVITVGSGILLIGMALRFHSMKTSE